MAITKVGVIPPIQTQILVSYKASYFLKRKHVQGLPWLRICCSQRFSHMEKVVAK